MQERRNQGDQPNIQKISTKRRTDDPRIQVVTKSEAVTGADKGGASTKGAPWVRKDGQKCPVFDPRQERMTF